MSVSGWVPVHVFAGDGLNSSPGVQLQQGVDSRVPIDVGRYGPDSVFILRHDPITLKPFPIPLGEAHFHFHFAHAVPQSHCQPSHHRHNRDFLLFRIARHQLLINPLGGSIVTDLGPAGLA